MNNIKVITLYFVDLIRMFDGFSYKITELYEVSKISWFDKI